MSPLGHFRQIDPLPTLSACPLRSDRVRTFAPQRIGAVCQLLDSCTATNDVRRLQMNDAVGTRVTSRPPHKAVRAAFPHTAPTSGV